MAGLVVEAGGSFDERLLGMYEAVPSTSGSGKFAANQFNLSRISLNFAEYANAA
jgi:hypothetical protein